MMRKVFNHEIAVLRKFYRMKKFSYYLSISHLNIQTIHVAQNVACCLSIIFGIRAFHRGTAMQGSCSILREVFSKERLKVNQLDCTTAIEIFKYK